MASFAQLAVDVELNNIFGDTEYYIDHVVNTADMAATNTTLEELDLGDLAFNNANQVSPSAFDALWTELANSFGFNANDANKLNLFIAFSASGTSPMAEYQVRFNGGAVKVNVKDIGVFLGKRKRTLRQFARSGFRWYEKFWTDSMAVVMRYGGKNPDTVDFKFDDSDNMEDSLIFRQQRASALTKGGTATSQKPPKTSANFELA